MSALKTKEVKLPSGAVLVIAPVPFADAKALYQALLVELRSIQIQTKQEVGDIYKNLFCVGFSSPKVEEVLWKCMARQTYNGQKIDENTFEPVEARGDYLKVCTEVAKEQVSPFLKSLLSDYGTLFEAILKDLK